MVTPLEVGARYGVSPSWGKSWGNKGGTSSVKYTDRGDCLNFPIDESHDALPESLKQAIVMASARSA